MLGQV